MDDKLSGEVPVRRTSLRRGLGALLVVLLPFAIAAGLAAISFRADGVPYAQAVGDTLNVLRVRFLSIFIEAAPFLLLGTLVSGMIEVFVPRELLVRLIPRNPIAATGVGTLIGFVFPVCECGVVPVTRRLMSKGLPMSVGVAFLLAAPVMNPIVVVSTYAAFGWGPILIGRFVITALVAAGIGILFALAARPQEVLLPAGLAPATGGSADAALPRLLPTPSVPLRARVGQSLGIAAGEFFEMGLYLIVGSLLAATMQTANVPVAAGGTVTAQDALLTLGNHPFLSVVALQTLAYVLSVCSTVDAFLALAFGGTFTTGALLGFLTFGPMVDIKSTLMFAGVFRRKVVVALIVLPFLLTLLVGVWINLNLPL